MSFDNAAQVVALILPAYTVHSLSRDSKVVNGEGAVSGLLNIARCLYDAIHRLEKKAMRAEEEGKGDVEQSLAASLIEVSVPLFIPSGTSSVRLLPSSWSVHSFGRSQVSRWAMPLVRFCCFVVQFCCCSTCCC